MAIISRRTAYRETLRSAIASTLEARKLCIARGETKAIKKEIR
jgi:hypothetical protein